MGPRPAIRFGATIALLGVVPALVIAAAFAHWLDAGTLAWDFHHELYPQAETMLAGDNPYPPPSHDPATGTNLVWPPLAAALVAPLTVLPPGTADVVMAVLGLGCFGAALWLVGVRDWRVYGVFALWPPVFMEPGLSHLTPFVALLLAAAWRTRESSYRSGALVGLAVGLKLLLWPVMVWLASIGRSAAAVVGAIVAGLSLLLVLPFIGLDDYLGSLVDLSRTFDQDAYTVYGLLVQAGAPGGVARAANLVLTVALLVATWRYRSFALAVATALVASPIVWLDYFALAAVPLAVVRPRLAPVWFVPLVTAGAAGAGLEIGNPLDTARVLVAFAVVFVAALIAERDLMTGASFIGGDRGELRWR